MRQPFDYLTQSYIICKYTAKFHTEEHADLVVSQ